MTRKTALRGRPSFQQRFAAWWDGVELPAEAPPAAKPQRRTRARSAAAAPAGPESPWPAARREIVQLVFGKGFVAPGRDYTLGLVRPFRLTKEMSFLEIGGGMGGGARAIAELWGTYVTSFERDPDLAEAGALQAEVHDLLRQATVVAMPAGNPSQIDVKDKFYDGALIRDVLPTIGDAETLIKRTVGALKPEAALVVADIFAGDAAGSEAAAAGGPGPFQPPALAAIEGCLTGAGLAVRKVKDVTDEYCLDVRRHWDAFVRHTERGRLRKDLVIPLVAEVERWARLGQAMEAQSLKVVQITAFRPPDTPV